jgi:hypothetical protein
MAGWGLHAAAPCSLRAGSLYHPCDEYLGDCNEAERSLVRAIGNIRTSPQSKGAKTLPDGCYSGKLVRGGSHAELPSSQRRPWFNHHRVMFRATGPTAMLTISDWASADKPGGPEAQELMVNYLQLESLF